VDSSGNVKVIADKDGSATITVKTNDGGYTAKCTVAVKKKNVAVTSISLNSTKIQLGKNEEYKLSATISPSNATNKTITWSSANTSIATVDSSGNVIAKGVGTTKITAKSNNGKSVSCNVYVTSLSITNNSTTIMDESTYKLKLQFQGDTGNETVTWKSSNTKIATVNSKGVITGKGVGTAKITASIKSSNSETIKSNEYVIKVRAIRVILVGNSKTYQSSLAINFAKIAIDSGYTVEGTTYNNYTENALSGYPAQDTSNNVTYFRDTGGKKLKQTASIHKTELNKSYDYIVIQEQTGAYSNSNYNEYYEGAANVLDIVYKKNSNIKMFIRKTWVLSDSDSATIKQGYTNTENVVKKLKEKKGYNITIINDGPSIYEAINNKYSVMKTDKRHQNTNGGYLAASCIYSTMFNKNPTSIKYTPSNINSTTATNLRKIASNHCK